MISFYVLAMTRGISYGETVEPGTVLKSADGQAVVYSVRTHQHMGAHAEILGILGQVIGKITVASPDRTGQWKEDGASGDVFGFEVEMGRKVGMSICVPSPAGDLIYFAHRNGRDIPTRVIRGADKVPTSSMCVWMRRYEDGRLELSTCYAGGFAPREPSDPYFTLPRTEGVEGEFGTALSFWSAHALIHNEGDDEPLQSSWQHELEKLDIL